ncbi:alpha-soluble NSF attachment protein, putative [Entamoeba invadens IP1]|uniref:Alpha-soluble NSF attachment protein, putative n=1 Tax=Entamoeba invadens IP1 TaxID=370355 RepID=A0A0A1TZ78_ENTIV|nr:alpha-soluble NSF attachment protein, putative [Entamoeba invadens IP1]ELP86877.1 alpha-soluble NSF attachment protein, putative [Entamoeba invadens IP1]|eukprot:XP_004253648.1 alpha-soluble NSF attachment protein, putative [Entamoeba invadens IP1]
MTKRNQKADQLYEEAATLETKWSIFSKEQNMSKAQELYNKAANLYKASEDYDKAALAFSKSNLLSTKLGDTSDANKALQNQALCLSKGTNPESAVDILLGVVENYIAAGAFSQASKTQQEIGKIFEELKKYDKAAEAYKTAASQYEMDNRPASALPLKISAAKLEALTGKYMDAYKTFDQTGMDQINQGALRFGAKEHFINAILCQMCNDDEIGAAKSVDKYKTLDPSLSSERDYKTMADLANALKEMDLDKFNAVVGNYTQLKQVDEFRRQLFEVLKKKIEDNANAALL